MHMQKFKNNGLLAHESEVNKLQDEGDRLVEIVKHPGSPAITVRLSITSVHHRQKTWSAWQIINTLSLVWTFFNLLKPGPQKCSANWVAGISQLVFGTRNTLGQHWRLQKGKKPFLATSQYSSKSTCWPKLFFYYYYFVQISSSWMQRCCLTPWTDSKPIWTQDF